MTDARRMDGWTANDITLLLIGLIITMMVLGFLRAIGEQYYQAVLWHNLRVEVQKLRKQQERRLQELGVNANGDEIIEEVQMVEEAESTPMKQAA